MPFLSITVIEQFFTDLNGKLPGIANAFSESVTEVQELVKEAKHELDEISKCDEVRRVHEVKVLYQYLNSTMEAVYTYLDKVNDLFSKLHNNTPAVIQDVERVDFKSVAQLVFDIEKTIQDCKKKCTILIEHCQEFATSCDKAKRKCRRLEMEAKENQRITQVAGGATTAGVAAGGIVTSVLVGIFTGGIGTVIGVSLTLAATAATATAAGATTLILSHKFGKAAESFGKLSRRFQRLQRDINTTQDRINGITSLPEINLVFNEQISVTISAYGEHYGLRRILRTTQDESTALYYQVSDGRNTAATSKDSLCDKYQSVY